jgi:hypothetical protein
MKCDKCGYESEDNKEIKGIYLCSICSKFAPEDEKLSSYLQEKLDWKNLESFRKYENKNLSGMKNKAREGKIMNRAPFGYKIINKELIPDEEKKLIAEEIFRDFLEKDMNLNQLAKKFKFSLNGIKKILKNFTYIGKIKFKGQITQGRHPQIISSELFNKVQNKLENL